MTADNPTPDEALDQAADRFDARANALRRDMRILEAQAAELEDVSRELRSDAAGYRMRQINGDEPTLTMPAVTAAGDPATITA